MIDVKIFVCAVPAWQVEIFVKGHANYDEKGKDIVCAGVSALCNALKCYLKHSKIPFKEEVSDGYLKLNIDLLEIKSLESIKVFYSGIHVIAEEYPEYVQLLDIGLYGKYKDFIPKG